MSARREETTFSLTYSVSTQVNAPAATLWQRLTDAAAFPSWNSTVLSVEGNIALGERLRIRVPLAPGRVFTPRVVELVPQQRMVWRDGMAPMFQGTRTFTLSAAGGGTDFHMEEVFKGVMLPLIKGSLPDFREAFERYAEDLKRSCERAGSA